MTELHLQRTPGAYIYDVGDQGVMTKECDVSPGDHRSSRCNTSSTLSLSLSEQQQQQESTDPPLPTTTTARCCSPARIGIGLFLLAIVAFVVVDSLTVGLVKELVGDFLHWIEENPHSGVVVFILVYGLATVMLIPASLLTLGAGVVFGGAFGLGKGTCIGVLAVFFGGSLGAIVSFILAKYLLRESVCRLSRKYAIFQALECALQENGLKIFTLLRLSPVAPFNVISYFGGISGVSFRSYALSLIAILPGTALYVFLGASAEKLTENSMMAMDMMEAKDTPHSRKVTIGIIVIGVVLGVGAIYMTTRYARRELRRILDERCTSQQEEQRQRSEDDPELGKSDDRQHEIAKTASSVDGESEREPSCDNSDIRDETLGFDLTSK